MKAQSVQQDLGEALTEMNLSQAEKQYRIIVIGDFNEIGRLNGNILQKTQWTPFADAGISTQVSIAKPIPLSCCHDGSWSSVEGTKTGDYIFDSSSAALTKVSPNYNSDLLQSDHLPIVSLLSQ